MQLRELFAQNNKTAVLAFGRMNPITIGHKKLAETIKSIPGDGYIFLSHTQNSKKDPLNFETKLKFAKECFPGITVGDASVRTIIEAIKKVNSLGYTNLVFVAGSDRVNEFAQMLNAYNNKEYFFESIEVVNAGDRDPDADGVTGISASKLREAAINNDIDTFLAGAASDNISLEMFNAVRKGMGISEQVEPDEPGYQHDLLTMPSNTLVIDTPGELDWYKIGQHFPALGREDPHEYGQSESDMVVSFANKKEMMNFVSVANRLGLKIKSIGGSPEHPEIHADQPVSENLKKNDLMSAFEKFFPIAMKVLDINRLPKIKLEKYLDQLDQPSFGRFENDTITIHLGLAGRHPIDILRTLAHELVHFKQLLNGQLDNDSGKTGSPDENEAHVKAGIIMRMFDKKYPEYFKSSVVESNTFTDARMNAIKAGKTEFKVGGKTYKVTGDIKDELEAETNENFADGKKPGRKGLAKRSGVNTKASVSSLRKTAKNSSGEKQRMAHWLANMKAGRKKAAKSESIVEFEEEEIHYSKKLAPVAKKLFREMYPDAKVRTNEDEDGYLSITTADGEFGFSIGVSHQYGDNIISVANAYAGNYRGVVGKLVRAAVQLLQKNHPDAETVLNTQHDVSDNYWTTLANKLGITYDNTPW